MCLWNLLSINRAIVELLEFSNAVEFNRRSSVVKPRRQSSEDLALRSLGDAHPFFGGVGVLHRRGG